MSSSKSTLQKRDCNENTRHATPYAGNQETTPNAAAQSLEET
jgi:hypothetical protein